MPFEQKADEHRQHAHMKAGYRQNVRRARFGECLQLLLRNQRFRSEQHCCGIAAGFLAEDVDKAVEQLRERFATTNVVERAAAEGDVVKVDLEAKVDGEVLADGVAEGVDYTIGSGELLEGIDEAVTGLNLYEFL